MRRRELIAGIGSVGVLATGAFVATGGADSLESRLTDPDVATTYEVETVEATGSEAGTLEIPSFEGPMYVDFFGTWCSSCIEQFPNVIEAHEQVGDEVTFVSVTNEPVGTGSTSALSPDELAAWWDDHDGQWTVALDPSLEVADEYGLQGYPHSVAIDAAGVPQWTDDGIKSTEEILEGIDQVR